MVDHLGIYDATASRRQAELVMDDTRSAPVHVIYFIVRYRPPD